MMCMALKSIQFEYTTKSYTGQGECLNAELTGWLPGTVAQLQHPGSGFRVNFCAVRPTEIALSRNMSGMDCLPQA